MKTEKKGKEFISFSQCIRN